MPKKHPISEAYIDGQISYWTRAKEIWLRLDIKNDDDFATVACKLYIKHGSVKTVAAAMNELGYRVPGFGGKPKNVGPNDVSDVIKGGSIEDKELLQFAKDIQAENLKFPKLVT